jgi:hypothetical protein
MRTIVAESAGPIHLWLDVSKNKFAVASRDIIAVAIARELAEFCGAEMTATAS